MNTGFSVRGALAACVLLVLAIMPPNATALTLSFSALTSNNPLAALAGEAQLSVDVTAVGGNQVQFQFFNVGSVASSITDIYFDDTSVLSGFSSLINGAGVNYEQGANPPNLPSGNLASPPFVTTPGFSFQSTAPGITTNGVNLGE